MTQGNQALVQLVDVWKEYQLASMRLVVLKNISVTIERGNFLVILGQSGSGKSTMLHIIGALDTPTRGKVFFEGQDTSRLTDDELATIRGKKIGFVFQKFNLLPALTALENVMMPAVFQKIDQTSRLDSAKKALDSVGLLGRMNHRPSELSGGEQQRVAIARALINDPQVIVADEPTGNTDSKTGSMIMEIFANLHRQEHRTVIVVTHEASYASYADRVLRIKDGEIIN